VSSSLLTTLLALSSGCGAGGTAVVSDADIDARSELPAPTAKPAIDGPRFARRPMPVGMMERPLVFGRHTFDPAKLARPKPISPVALADGGWMTIQGNEERYFSRLGRPLVAELEVDVRPPYRAYAGAAEPRSFLRRPPGAPPCGPDQTGNIGARWSGILATEWSEEALVFESYEGAFDKRTCRARASRGETVTATAVVPGILYAFRRCGVGCRPGDFEPAEDEVVFVAPPAEWVSSPSSAEEQATPHIGTLTVVSVPLRLGGAVSAAFVLDLENVDFFEALRSTTTEGFTGVGLVSKGLAMRADVTWPTGEASPTGVVFLSSLNQLPGSPAH
jgi:hypothetical protein